MDDPADDESDPPALDYRRACVGTRFAAVLVRGDREWAPDPVPRMPYHHASRLELVDDDGRLAAVEAAGTTRIAVTLVIERVDIAAVPGRQMWRGTYVARLVNVRPHS
jgi:hypothetical protein